jgi:hypothetical protein
VEKLYFPKETMLMVNMLILVTMKNTNYGRPI